MELSKKRGYLAKIALLTAVSCLSLFTSCSKDELQRPTVDPPMVVNSIYVYNEGQYGKTMGSVNIFNYGDSVITKTEAAFGNTTCHGTSWMGKLYFSSKQGKRLVVVDPKTLNEIASTEELNGRDGRSFIGIDDKTGVIATDKGAYRIDLKTLKVGDILEQSEKQQCGGMYVSDNYLFVIHAVNGILVYDVKNNLAFVKNLGQASVGFTVSKDGSLWAANTTTLLKIDAKTLTVETVTLPADLKIYNSWGAWNKGSLCAAPNENSLYFIKAANEWGGGNSIYRYEIGNIKSLDKPFAISTKANYSFYGSGIAVDPISGNIFGITVEDGWGDHFKNNCIVQFNHKTGEEIAIINYEGLYFPSGILFVEK